MSAVLPVSLSDILGRWRSLGRVTTLDIVRWTQQPESTVEKWFSGDREPNYSVLQVLSKHASRIGLNDIASSLISPEFEVCRRTDSRANGSFDDEAADLMIAGGQGASAHRAGDLRALDQSIEQAEDAVARMKAERDRLAAQLRG